MPLSGKISIANFETFCKWVDMHNVAIKSNGWLLLVIDTFTPHQLRHTFCTLMYFAGVDVMTARDQMGHKDISVTLGIYTALDKKFKKKKINRLDAYLKKNIKQKTG